MATCSYGGCLVWPCPHLYLSEERSARFLSRRERFNIGTLAQLFLHSGISGPRCVRPLPNPLLGQGEGITQSKRAARFGRPSPATRRLRRFVRSAGALNTRTTQSGCESCRRSPTRLRGLGRPSRWAPGDLSRDRLGSDARPPRKYSRRRLRPADAPSRASRPIH
jgi:hypothetical protein